MISSIIFILVFIAAFGLFGYKLMKIKRNIFLGQKKENRFDQPQKRLKTMTLVALGQSKMVTRPIAAFLHIIVYVGFVLINIEVLEIFIDGAFNQHRFFQPYLGSFYNILIGFFEILGFGVMVACAIFLVRRYTAAGPKRLQMKELKGFPNIDATAILATEIVLMSCLLIMNAVDHTISGMPISGLISPLFAGLDAHTAHIIMKICWWAHLIGILIFLNYLPYSKHFHILLAFPNTYFSNLKPLGQFNNLEAVTNEVKLMLDPNADPFAAPATDGDVAPVKFGAKDVTDLSWKNLLDAYTCTECGRCTSECPANTTGKLLSPRKIMMSTRDRLEEVSKNIDKNGADYQDGKSLLGDYITEEELWACTSCNACTNACPVNIDPLNIILELRRDLVMEQSKTPAALANMMTNIENNGAPWQFSQADRLNWAQEQ